MERHNRNCSNATTYDTATSSGENVQQRQNQEALSSGNSKTVQIYTTMDVNCSSDSSNNGQRSINVNNNGNKASNATNNSNCKSAVKVQSLANVTSSVSHEIRMYCNGRDTNSSVTPGISRGSSAEQAYVTNQSHRLLESEYLTSADIAPASFYENLIEEMDKSIIMLKKSLDKVLEMRVSMAELKLSLKEISSPELVCKAEELSSQLTTLEESHSRFNEMVLSLNDEIRPKVNNYVNDINGDRT